MSGNVTKIDWTKPVKYVTPAKAWEPSWWERGLVRYGVLSYSLWTRTIWNTHKLAFLAWMKGR